MTTAQKQALIEKLDDIIDSLASIATLLEASLEIEADPLAGHPELPLATENQP